MSQVLCPLSFVPFLDANGDPLVGALLFTYLENTTTKTTTTKDQAGASNHTNPIVLTARGMPGDTAGAAQAIWSPAGTVLKLVLAPASDTDPPTSLIDSWNNISGINDTSTALDEWIVGPAPTFISATSFTLVGDQTSAFQVGRKLKSTNTAGTIYSTIITSVYTSLTTVTVINDSGVLDSGLSAVWYGLLSATNPSLSVEGVTHVLGPDIASATALPYPAYGTYSDVTGTTTITSMATSGILGTVVKRHFDGILTLTHHATDLILPGGVNITTAAGDEAEFVEYASGDWRCTKYTEFHNATILGPDIASATALSYPTYGTYSDVTGTTAITSMDTSGVIGTVVKRHFDEVLTLTHHATDLILPGGVDIETAAGDEAEFVEYASGDWRCTDYNNKAAVSNYSRGTIIYVENNAGSNATTFDIDAVIGAAWESIGPTGSGATNIWTAMNDIPGGAKFALVKVINHSQGGTNGDSYFATIHARKTGDATAVGNTTNISTTFCINRSGSSEADRNTIVVPIPIDTSRRFDLYVETGGTSISLILNAYLVGWGI